MKEPNFLAELRAWRDKFAQEHNYDLAAMAAKLRELDVAADARVLHGEPHRPLAEPNGASTPSRPLPPTGAAS